MEIPRNIRQIGDIDQDLRLYMEDYVATFIEKLKRRNDTFVGVFLGKQAADQEIPCLFIRGAVLMKQYEVEDSRIVMTASSWNEVYEQTEACFQDVEICGWFLCCRDEAMADLYGLQKSHNENFKGQGQIFYLYNGSREEEAFYRFDFHGAHRLKGYYIYYERNEQMQEYMISQEPVRKSEFSLGQPMRGASDEAAARFREIMGSRQKETKAGQKQKKEQAPGAGVSRLLRTVSVAALLCGAGFGLASWYRYDKMQGVRDALAVLAGRDSVREETEESGQTGGSGGDGETEQGTEESGQAVVSEIPGNVNPTEASPSASAPAAETSAASSQASQSGQETSGSAAGASESTEEETEQETEPETTEASATEAPVREYVVKSGDTLGKICEEIYGSAGSALIDEICSLNGMDNADFIYEGQTLRLPEN